MEDFTRSYAIAIAAPVHEVFEYCLDPRHLFAGWSALTVSDVEMTPDGTGTTARIEGRWAGGLLTEDIVREFTEVRPDERIVTRAHARMRFAGMTKDVPNGPVFTWIFTPDESGTTLTLVILEEDLNWWQRTFEAVSEKAMSNQIQGMLREVKSGVERSGTEN